MGIFIIAVFGLLGFAQVALYMAVLFSVLFVLFVLPAMILTRAFSPRR